MTLLTQVFIGASGVLLVISAVLALVRLAKGPTGLDRGVASDLLIAVLIAGIATYTIATRSEVALIIIVVLSLVGFTSAVGLARLITGTSARERRFLQAEARAADLARQRAERQRAERAREETAERGPDPASGGEEQA